MPRATVPFYALNRGEVSRYALGRVDAEKLRMSADKMVNWMPLTMGPMTLRAGTEFVGEIKNSSACRLIEFVYATNDYALIELTPNIMRIWKKDPNSEELDVLTRDAVTSSIPTFSGTNWTTVVQPSASSATVTANTGSLIIKDVTQGAVCSAWAAINCTGNVGKNHGLRIPVTRGGNVIIKIGTAVNKDDVFPVTSLGTGTHSINFTPTTNIVYVQFESKDARSCLIGQLSIESSGEMTLPTPWGASDIHSVRFDQSADVIYCASYGYQQRRIERRSNDSWSITLYETEDGPFPALTGDPTYNFTPGALRGDTTLTSNKSFFTSNMVGCLVRLFHVGQNTQQTLNVVDTATSPVIVTGNAETTFVVSGSTASASTTERMLTINISGLTGTGNTVVLQRTFDPEGMSDWVDVGTTTNTKVTSASGAASITYGAGNYTFTADIANQQFSDRINNVKVHYRLYMKTYNSGNTVCNISTSSGGGSGIARIYEYTSQTSVKIQVLKPFLATTASSQWRLSEWQGPYDWPTSVTIHEGRLWWAGGSRIFGSVSDNYFSFDFEMEGDASPINRAIGKGPIQNTNFMLSLGRLTIGTDAGIVTARSSSVDEPLTTTKFNIKYTNTQGTADVRAVACDQKGLFVQRSGRRVYMITFTTQQFDYKTDDLTRLNIDIGVPGFSSIAVQRQIDTRFWFVRNDGQIAVLLFDEADEVLAWTRLQAANYDYAAGDGIYENVAILPGELEDQVFVVVKRKINGVTKRYLEKFARLDQCVGDTTTRLLDCHATYSGAATSALTGLSYLEGKTVGVWGVTSSGVGRDLGTYTVTNGMISNLPSVTSAVVGLPYTAQFVSSKLAFAAAQGTAINQFKRVNKVGFMLDQTHYQGVRYGQYDIMSDTYTADDLPLVEDGAVTASDTVWQRYDQQQFALNGKWDTDSRIYLEAASPRPATVLGFTIEMETSG